MARIIYLTEFISLYRGDKIEDENVARSVSVALVASRIKEFQSVLYEERSWVDIPAWLLGAPKMFPVTRVRLTGNEEKWVAESVEEIIDRIEA